jgi:hypothetical protein
VCDRPREFGSTTTTHPFSIITQPPLVANGTVYVGAASAEENNAAFIPGYAQHTRTDPLAGLGRLLQRQHAADLP